MARAVRRHLLRKQTEHRRGCGLIRRRKTSSSVNQTTVTPAAQLISSLPPAAQAVANVTFVGLAALLLYRVVKRRASLVTSTRFTSDAQQGNDELEPSSSTEQWSNAAGDVSATPLQSLIGGTFALVLGVVTLQLAQQVDMVMIRSTGSLATKGVELQQIGSTLRTIVSGIVFLAAFVFAFNGAGLVALSARSLLFGSSVGASENDGKNSASDSIDEHE